jgi:hypothetical protein
MNPYKATPTLGKLSLLCIKISINVGGAGKFDRPRRWLKQRYISSIVQVGGRMSHGARLRAALAGIQGRGEAWEVDLQEVPGKNRVRNPHALDHNPAAN